MTQGRFIKVLASLTILLLSSIMLIGCTAEQLAAVGNPQDIIAAANVSNGASSALDTQVGATVTEHGTQLEVEGVVQALTSTSITINGKTFTYDPSVVLKNANTLQVGGQAHLEIRLVNGSPVVVKIVPQGDVDPTATPTVNNTITITPTPTAKPTDDNGENHTPKAKPSRTPNVKPTEVEDSPEPTETQATPKPTSTTVNTPTAKPTEVEDSPEPTENEGDGNRHTPTPTAKPTTTTTVSPTATAKPTDDEGENQHTPKAKPTDDGGGNHNKTPEPGDDGNKGGKKGSTTTPKK